MPLTRTLNLIYDTALALLYPQPCPICGASVESRADGVACSRCWKATRLFSVEEPLCWKCGAPAGGSIAPEKRSQVNCRRCDAGSFDAARACGVYEGALRASVLALKREPHLPRRLTELLAKTARQPPIDTAGRIIPVPLHPEREKTRGFNQARTIGVEVARGVGLPIDSDSLIRVKHSERHRAGMDAKGRRETVANAFFVRNPRLIAGESILLVDDVFTTGATVSACAEALKEAGAKQVFVLTLARGQSL